LRARLDEAAAAVGIKLHITFEASAPELLADLAARQLGWPSSLGSLLSSARTG
jgi:hypothetical protein